MFKPSDVMKLPEGKHCDGDYLWLAVKGASRSWVVRTPMINGKRREIGLGSAAKISLALARKHRDALLEQLRNGVDPVAERQEAKDAAAKRKTFAEVAETVIEKNRAGWKISLEGNCSTLDQWRRDLTVTCRPIARKFVDEITIDDIEHVLQCYWGLGQLDAASSLRQRIEKVFGYAISKKLRASDNPASWRVFEHLWPGQKAKSTHYAALPWRETPEFVERLREAEEISARLLEFIILTAVRSNEARGARWSEIDFDARVWAIPAARMKMHVVHEVPLSDQAIAVLRRMEARKTGSDLVFAGGRGVGTGKPMRNASLWALVQRTTGSSEATTHGLRSTFRDWCGENGVDREVAERCLAHSLGNKAENAYARSSLIARRRPIMEAWGAFVDGSRDNVLPFVRQMA